MPLSEHEDNLKNRLKALDLQNEEGFKKLYSMMTEGVCLSEIIYDDQGKPVDYRILDVNKSFERITGISRKKAAGRLAAGIYQADPPPDFDIFLKVAHSGKPATFEAYWTSLDKFFLISAFSPRQGCFTALFTDTTDQNIQKEQLSITLDAVGEGVIETDLDGRVTSINKLAETMTGWKSPEAIGRDIDEVFNGISLNREIHENLIKKILREKQGTGFSDHRLLISRSGRKYVVEERAVPVKKRNGAMAGLFIIFRDRTEQYHADEALKQSRARYKELFKAIPIGVVVFETVHNGEDFIIREFNPAAEKIENIPKERVIGQSVAEAFPGVEKFGLFEVLKRVWETGTSEFFPVSLYEDNRHGKTWRENHVYKLPSGEVVAVYSDVTERMRSMEEIKEREQKYRFLFENMAQGVFYRGADGALIDANRSALEIFGMDEEGFQRIRVQGLEPDIIHEDGTRFAPEEFPSMMAFKTGKAVNHVTAGIYNREKNAFVWTCINAIPQFRAGEKTPFQIFVTLHDITDIKKAEMDVREHQEELDAIYQNSRAIMMLTDEETRIYKINRAAAESSGRHESEMIGMRGGDALNCPYAAEAGCGKGKSCIQCSMRKIMSDTLETGKSHLLVEAEMPIQYKGEELVLTCLLSTVKLTIKNKPMVLSTIVDITGMKQAETKLRKLEERLSQAQKMEALGTLAGGIAHDFNNILFPLMGYAEMLRDDIPDGDPSKSNVEEILLSAYRARDLVQQILTFSRHSKSERKPVRVQTILKEAVKLLRSSIPKTISIHYDLDEDCGLVMADPAQIHQIIMNLGANAFHAMEETGGRLSISLKQIRLGSGDDPVDGLMPGDYLWLKVADSGMGIPKEIQEKVFDPYFSTKTDGKGTGLGLAIVQGIVKSTGGEIRIKSEPGKGTEAHIYLPAMARAERPAILDDDSPTPGGREKILIVDDEEPIIEMEKMMLERLGYQVTSSTFSADAFETFKKDPDRFDLIITDMTMPDLTGFQLSCEIKKIRPDMPVILCTGYSEQVDEEKCKTFGIEGYVMKPFAKRQMAETIRRILDQGGSSFNP